METSWSLFFIFLCLGSAISEKQKADESFLKKQLAVLKLSWRLSQPNSDPEQAKISSTYNPLDNLAAYSNADTVQTFFEAVNSGEYKPRGEIFNLFDPKDRREAVELFDCLFFAKDWDLFYKTAVFARDRVNEGQFYYAFMVAVIHRPEGLELPPPYEVFPNLFTNYEVIREAYKAKMRQTPAIIPMNFTGTIRNPETRVSYFGEDIGLNAHHSNWHAKYPFWWDDGKYGAAKDRNGELFWYMHHQMTVRFDAERLSNGLSEVEELGWDKPILEGFVPKATYKNGQEFPSRPDNMRFEDLPFITVNDMRHYEVRIREAIASGYLVDSDHNSISLNNSRGIELLGDALESNANSVDSNYYGSLHNLGHVFLSRVTDPKKKFGLAPGVMEHFETATRDPAFFRLHKYIDNLLKEHKDFLPPYTTQELDFPGVRVDGVEVRTTIDNAEANTLVTYFDTGLMDMSNAMETSDSTKDVEIKAQFSHLAHVPFTYTISVDSNKATSSVVRIFLLLKNNWFGEELSIEEAQWGAIELDKFVVKLNPGQNTISRSSVDSSVTLNERKGQQTLKKEVEEALAGKGDYFVDSNVKHCGLPHGLLIPKGNLAGMDFRLFVTLSDYEKDIHVDSFKQGEKGPHSYCGVLGNKYPDKRPMGFPLDRKIPNWETWKTDNMKDVFITVKHKALADVSFSPEEISAIKSTWGLISSNPTANGVSVYLTWFASHPEIQSNFKRFANVSRADLATNDAFKTQATVTINRLGTIISFIDEPLEFKKKLVKLAGDHKFRDANVNDFRDMTNIMVDVFGQLTGSQWTPSALSGWKKFFARLLQKIGEETAFTHTKLAKVQLSPEEMTAVKNNWATISEDLEGHGVAIYLRWFQAHPHVQQLFKKFSDVPVDQLADNQAFKTQGAVTLHRLDDMIESIDSPAEMAAKMKRLGRVHQDRSTNVNYFRGMTKVIIDYFQSVLGSNYSQASATGWAKVFAKLVENVGDGLAQKN